MNPNHTRRPADSIAMHKQGKDPFGGLSTGYLLGSWRAFVASGRAHYQNFPPDADELRACPNGHDGDYDPVEQEYMVLLKAELDKRPHLLNKKEGKERRRMLAKQGR